MLKIITDNLEEEFSLSLFLNRPDSLQKKDRVKEIVSHNIPFRITFETFNWDASKSTAELFVVEKGRFLVEKVE